MLKHLENKTIFMVEDNALNSAIMRTILLRHGANVPYDHWGDKSLYRMANYASRIDLILLESYFIFYL